ncbi:MAG: DUF934 domain-containing protein [Hydrogenophaga sp.]|nr:DUF934 domain-containing protein [Hydrogenophaga sp.]
MSALLDALGQPIKDLYLLLADDTELPTVTPVIVSLARWQAEAAVLSARTGPVAVKLLNTADVLTLDAALLARPLLVLDFPAFGDGRGYSQARRLRDRDQYAGSIRATGAAVVADQLAMMARCGITEFALREDQVLTVCQAALASDSKPLPYQTAQDRSAAVFDARRS